MDSFIDQVYEAAVVPDRWPVLLDRIGQHFDAKGGLIFTASTDGTRWIGGGEVVDIMQEFMAAGWMAHNDRPARVLARNHPGFLTELDVMTDDETRELPVFRDFLRPKGCFATAGTFVNGLNDDKMIVSVEGFLDHDASHAAVPYLDSLRPHLGRAVQLTSQFKLERMKGQVEALNAIGAAACVLNARGVLKVANARFESELGSLFYEGGARIHLADRSADEQLSAALSRLSSTSGTGCSIVVRGANAAARVLHVIPIRGQANDLFINVTALVVLTNPVEPIHFSIAFVQQLFDMTPAEARVASLIGMEGRTLQEVADYSGVSINTVKSQLRSVFEKTGTKRQAELVRLLVSAKSLSFPTDVQ